MGKEVGPEPEQTLWEASAVWVEGDEVSLRRKRYNLRVCMGGILESMCARGASNVWVDLREVVGHVEAQSVLPDGRRVGRLPTRTHGRDGLQVCLAIPQGGIKDAGEPSTAHVVSFKLGTLDDGIKD